MTWGLTVKREGIFENALRVDVKIEMVPKSPFDNDLPALKFNYLNSEKTSRKAGRGGKGGAGRFKCAGLAGIQRCRKASGNRLVKNMTRGW